MKTFLTTIALFTLAPIAFASTVAVTPATMNVVPGQTFSVTLVVTPDAAADYTAKVALSYPANLLQEVSFTQSSGWLPLSQSGYDVVDNTNGSLVKTAGYAGGFSSVKVFGTATFRAVTAGTASITPAAGTQILDANNNNTYSSAQSAVVSISAPVLPVVTVPKTTPTKNPTNPSRTPLTVKSSKVPEATTALATSSPAEATSTSDVSTSTDVALVAESHSGFSLPIEVVALVGAFLLGLLFGRGQRIS